MLKVGHLGAALSLALAMSCQRAPAGGTASCRPPTPDPSLQRAVSDSLGRALRMARDSYPTPDAELAVAGVSVSGQCAVGATLSWDNGFSGGVLVYRPRDRGLELLAARIFPGARAPQDAGANRFLFAYGGGRGSGQSEERTAVLCALAADDWVRCADLVTNQEVAATGYPASDSLATGMHLSSHGRTAVRGDTLFVTSDIEVKRYGRALSRRTVTWYQVLP
jgi:hypothetical protein